ncbi:MAG TPA: SUMF1/EgtB/PvdO family nonheme iron enzyme [Dongiaceae bacterium]|nr:SUMF1/EgtB/PvdO family nonheme iron enzyme [Dongiaceae bacterium]
MHSRDLFAPLLAMGVLSGRWSAAFRRQAAGFAALLAMGILSGCGRPNAETHPVGTQVLRTACGMAMVSIPSGRFIMGSNEGPIDTKPAHAITVDGFLMDQCEITQEVYQRVTGANPSRRKHPQNPVEQVTWSAAVRFCNARSLQEGLKPCYDTNTWACDFSANGYRLPTEAEWEYACRAGASTAFYFGDNAQELKSFAWFEGNSPSGPHPAAQRKPNAWGLYDMAGNVWEWCNDFYWAKYYRQSPQDNPRGPNQGEKRVLRGGAWSSRAGNCTSWSRNCDEAGLTDVCLTMDSNGFRCVRRR